MPQPGPQLVSSLLAGDPQVFACYRGGQKSVFGVTLGSEKWALKVIVLPDDQPTQSNQEAVEEVVSRATREVEILKTCESPYLVKIGPNPLSKKTIEGTTYLYYLEEWVAGKSLLELLESKQNIPESDLRVLAQHMLLAIGHLWEHGLIHRDIKPGNILVRDTGGYVLVDYGYTFDLRADSLSRTGILHGTAQYFSPEQTYFESRRELDFRSDLFSLGSTLYEYATLVHPFFCPPMTVPEIFKSIRHFAPKPVCTIRSDISSLFSDFVQRLLQKEPHQRFRLLRHASEYIS